MHHHSRQVGMSLPLFEPLRGTMVRSPQGEGPGWWAGAPGVFYDAPSGRFYLTYRLREPRPVRGGITRLAVSDDGVNFEDIFECRKEQLGSQSIERCAIHRGLDDVWRWYVSYVDPDTGMWRTDVVEADAPERFDVDRRRKVFCAADLPGIEGVKDPYLVVIGRLYYLVLSVAQTLQVEPDRETDKHATGDIFNTGLTVSSTGLAVSHNGVDFRWLGVADSHRGDWDRYCFRVNSIVWTPPVFTAFYDGSASVEENYEERCGLAQSFDLRSFERVSVDGPAIVVPHGSGSVRYVDVVVVGHRYHYYYEMVRPDGAHELRVQVV